MSTPRNMIRGMILVAVSLAIFILGICGLIVALKFGGAWHPPAPTFTPIQLPTI